jgi:acyl-coenzyme A synthetase/AMP-(fatty) acid ligase/uncharacterized membrane protein/3-hydroxymyristoyl/3-hydroxydecanoyl-(acyl carrier protein) dehydratase
MVFRFALLMEKFPRRPIGGSISSIRGSLGEKRIAAYCRKVTALWCLFFTGNGVIAALTVFRGSEAVWALYNGGISYILMGILFGVELIVRKTVQKSIPGAVPLSAFTPGSRSPGRVLCYSGRYSEKQYKTWADFLAGTAAIRSAVTKAGRQRWILHCNDYWYFLLAYTALLQCRREVLLTANISPGYIAEIIAGGTEGEPVPAGPAAFLTDERDALGLAENSFYVPALVDTAAETPASQGTALKEPVSPGDLASPVPSITADETVIVLYTSGTTGQPKAIRQRLTEFEKDNAFILSKWGDEFLTRKVCSTVSPHHIFGLLFSVMLPFTAGVPFRRERIEYPETFKQLSDDSYLIITVPALLKRSVEMAGSGSADEQPQETFGLRSPWIFTSGGAVPQGIAAATEKLFGFWPLEVYGSTETSGIAWRQSRTGPEWTPFDNAEVWKNEDGCLVIKSPYIRNTESFTTGDLVEFLPGGRFLLKGRADSIVKIEEKRISLAEMENRIMQSALVADTAVIALQDKRQYLAAAVVLNKEGKERFGETEKFRINAWFREYLQRFFENMLIPKKWRYVEALPRNPQGKLKKQELESLFRSLKLPQGIRGTVSGQTEDSCTVEFSVPGTCPYFDGHFQEFPILPAAAQFELVCACAGMLVPGFTVTGSRRTKFSRMIGPGADLRLEINIDRETKTLRFTLTTAAKTSPARICSTGTVTYKTENPLP